MLWPRPDRVVRPQNCPLGTISKRSRLETRRAESRPSRIGPISFWREANGGAQLFRIESERLKLSAPFGRRIAEPLDADAAGQATFYGGFDKIGCKEGKRDGHIDLSNAALLASAK